MQQHLSHILLQMSVATCVACVVTSDISKITLPRNHYLKVYVATDDYSCSHMLSQMIICSNIWIICCYNWLYVATFESYVATDDSHVATCVVYVATSNISKSTLPHNHYLKYMLLQIIICCSHMLPQMIICSNIRVLCCYSWLYVVTFESYIATDDFPVAKCVAYVATSNISCSNIWHVLTQKQRRGTNHTLGHF